MNLIEPKINLFPDDNYPIVSAEIENINSDQYRVTAAFVRKSQTIRTKPR